MEKKNILIIDENKDFSGGIKSLLEGQGCKVDVACNRGDALNKVNHYPDLILLRSVLSDMSGVEICRQIRQNKRLEHISIIMVSQQEASAHKADGLLAGADDYVVEPIDHGELIARMEAVLRRNHTIRQSQEGNGKLVAELKTILDEEKVTSYFQPIYLMKSRLPYGLEALSRPATNGLIDNAEFLFKTALILDMYSEVEMLCWRKAVSFWKEFANREKLFLNCTPYFIESGRLNREFLSGLDIDLGKVVLEITERTAIQKKDLFVKELQDLRKLGILIAVDDVGSGFASLDTVVEIRPDIVKIDRHLISNLHKDELRYNITQAVVTFCRKSKIMTVAEGIEYEEELAAVDELGIDAIQGYLVGKPAPEISPDIFTKKFGG